MFSVKLSLTDIVRSSTASPFLLLKGYGFGWAAKGFTHDSKAADSAPASLTINPWMSEPDTRSGEKPEALSGK